MSKVLIVSYLPREGSNTAKLVEAYKQAVEGAVITERSLSDGAVPLVSEGVMKTWWGPKTDNEVEAASAEYITELKNADIIVLATPMYNWSLPAPVKAWLDLVIRSGQTFEFGADGVKGLLNGQKVGLLTTTGMTALESEGDHLTPLVKAAFSMMGGGEFKLVGASELLIISEEEASSRMETALAAARKLATS